MRTLRRIQYLLNRRKREQELAEELALHRAMAEQEYASRGMNPADARNAAARRMGNSTAELESMNSVWYPIWFEGLVQDVRHACRRLSRSPMLMLLVCLSLGLSTGFGTALFSVVNAVVLQPMTAADPDSLVYFWVGESNTVSAANLDDLCERTPGVSCVGHRIDEMFWTATDSMPQRLVAQTVSGDYFPRIGVKAAQGRVFSNATEGDLAVVTHAFWQRRLNGRPDVVGAKLVLNGYPYSIAGVLPKGFRSLYGLGISPSIYLPIGSAAQSVKSDKRDHRKFELVGVLQPEQSSKQFQAAVLARTQDLRQLFPLENQDFTRVLVWPVHRLGMFLQRDENVSTVVLMFGALLLAMVLLLIVIACVNVAGLLVARAASRQHEIAVRTSLGCGKLRLARLLLSESFLLALLGVSVGAVLSSWLAKSIVATPLPLPVPFEVEVPIDSQLLAFLAGIVFLTTLISGLAPVLQAWRLPKFIRSSQGVSGGSRRWSIRGCLVAGQVAISAVLLICTVLFLRSLSVASQIDPGFDMDRVVTVELEMPAAQFEAAQKDSYQKGAIAALREAPGVSAVSGARIVPLSMDVVVTSLQLENNSSLRGVKGNLNWVLPEYFKVMGIPIVAGRDFVSSDRGLEPRFAIVNQAFVRRYFADGKALGKRFRRPAPPPEPEAPWAEIIGVVADSRYFTLGEPPTAQVYWPYGTGAMNRMKLFVRTEGNAAALAHTLPNILRNVDARVSVRAQPLRAVMGVALFPAKAAAFLLASLGIVAWALTAAGLYGVVAYTVSRRIPEIGLRMALGASARSIWGLLLRDGLALTTVGLVAGLGLAAFATPMLSMFLAGVPPHDPLAFAIVGLALIATAAAATYVPARRGTRLRPSDALRTE